jgi:class 3 adenylate cyclase
VEFTITGHLSDANAAWVAISDTDIGSGIGIGDVDLDVGGEGDVDVEWRPGEGGARVLAPDIRISNRSVSLLFTGLTGSTAMYEKLGGAKAFAIVRDHVTILRRVTESHGGVIVKTIGDAIMAAFSDPVKTMAAALEMVDALDSWVADGDLGVQIRLRVGFHVGPALMFTPTQQASITSVAP